MKIDTSAGDVIWGKTVSRTDMSCVKSALALEMPDAAKKWMDHFKNALDLVIWNG